MDTIHGAEKVQAMRARTDELRSLIPSARASALLWWARKHYASAAGLAAVVDRMLADPAGDGGEEFAELADQLVIFATALREKATA